MSYATLEDHGYSWDDEEMILDEAKIGRLTVSVYWNASRRKYVISVVDPLKWCDCNACKCHGVNKRSDYYTNTKEEALEFVKDLRLDEENRRLSL